MPAVRKLITMPSDPAEAEENNIPYNRDGTPNGNSFRRTEDRIRVGTSLDRQHVELLKALARRHGVNMNVVIMAALDYYSRQT